MALLPPTGLAATAYANYNEIAWTNGDTYTTIGIYRKKPGERSFSLLDSVSYPTHKYYDYDVSALGTYSYYAIGVYVLPGGAAEQSPGSNTFSRTRYGDSVSDVVGLAESTSLPGNYASSVSDTVTVDESATLKFNWSTVVSDTVKVSEHAVGSQSIKTNFAHYIGMDDGTVHATAPEILSDNGSGITSIWETVETDLGMPNTLKTVHRANLKYVDKSASTPVTIAISNDGGRTWTPATYTVGTGDGKTHSKFFWYVMTGEYFKFKVELASTDKAFQVIALDVDFQPCGEVIET